MQELKMSNKFSINTALEMSTGLTAVTQTMQMWTMEPHLNAPTLLRDVVFNKDFLHYEKKPVHMLSHICLNGSQPSTTLKQTF